MASWRYTVHRACFLATISGVERMGIHAVIVCSYNLLTEKALSERLLTGPVFCGNNLVE